MNISRGRRKVIRQDTEHTTLSTIISSVITASNKYRKTSIDETCQLGSTISLSPPSASILSRNGITVNIHPNSAYQLPLQNKPTTSMTFHVDLQTIYMCCKLPIYV